LDVENSVGNGFRFDHYSADAFRWAIDSAMDFYALPLEIREREIRRVMIESEKQFSHKEVARRYINIYEEMLARPLVEKESGEFIKSIAESLSGSAVKDLVEA
jgi:starch synthase/alpha-amylase